MNWNILTRELELITPYPEDFLSMWLSARWSDTENVNNGTLEKPWDFYTEQRINWTLPFKNNIDKQNTKSREIHTDLN